MADQDWRIIGTGDFNGDGKADILWRQVHTGESAIWLIDGVTLLGAGFTQAPGSP